MKTFVNSLAHWDVVFATVIFGLNGRKLLSFSMPWISHTANGYYYPAVPAVMLLLDPHKAWSFFVTGLFAFASEWNFCPTICGSRAASSSKRIRYFMTIPPALQRRP